MTQYDIEVKVVELLKTVFDPEIPVNVYDMGLIYKIDVSENEDDSTFKVDIDMTLTAPNCPAADFIIEDITQKIESIEGVSKVNVQLVFEPEWDKSMMSEEAQLDLGFM
ncbi:MAG: metal-sulfur cluster assembly factor [Bacteroidaceae bacterium]|nr:metal-sulfur cluster assembly factor [Bacteroidaceae bacterium]